MEEKNENSVKRDNFKWFIAVLIFLLLSILIVVVGLKPKNIFDSCYETCMSIAGVEPNTDGSCNNLFHKNKNNLCVSDNLEGRCFAKCTGK